MGSFQALGLFLYWPVSRCAKSKGKVHGQVSGGGGETAGGCGVRGELCKEVTEGEGFALEIVMGGWVFENEAGCKCCQCRMREESGPSGDEGGGGGLAQQCWGVACFGSGEVGEFISETWFRQISLGVHCRRKFWCQAAGPPGSIDWTQPWHTILHQALLGHGCWLIHLRYGTDAIMFAISSRALTRSETF